MFKHMAKMRIPESIVEKELAAASEDGWEIVSVVSTSSISGDRAVSMFFKKPVATTVDQFARSGGDAFLNNEVKVEALQSALKDLSKKAKP